MTEFVRGPQCKHGGCYNTATLNCNLANGQQKTLCFECAIRHKGYTGPERLVGQPRSIRTRVVQVMQTVAKPQAAKPKPAKRTRKAAPVESIVANLAAPPSHLPAPTVKPSRRRRAKPQVPVVVYAKVPAFGDDGFGVMCGLNWWYDREGVHTAPPPVWR